MKKEITYILIKTALFVAAVNATTVLAQHPVFRGTAVISPSVLVSNARLTTISHRRTKKQNRTRILRHRIRRGDSITSIARRYRISRTQLIRRNKLRRPYRLRIGRRLYIKRIRIERRVVIRSENRSRRNRSSRHRKRKTGKRVVKTIRVRTYRHKVRRGETVRSIARGYRVSQRQIIRLNRLRRPYRIRHGRVLIIKRVKTVTYKRTTVAKASHRSKSRKQRSAKSRKHIKRRLTVTAHNKVPAKKVAKYKPRKKLPPMRVRTYTHRVRRGDNLRRLSRRYKVSQGQIIRLNRLRHPYRLRAGRRLLIKRVMIRVGHDEFKLGSKKEWKEIKQGKPGSKKIASRSKKSHKYNVKNKKPSTIRGNRSSHLKNKRGATNGASRNALKRHIATPGTSRRSVINRRVEHVDPGKGGFMSGVGRWIWPANGKLDSRFSRTSKGIKISGQLGQGIYAAAKGKIVYIGDSLIRYGNLVIIKHNSIFFTAYAHNRRLLVREGQFVRRGQKIAEMGSASSGKIVLHFEIRKDGRPVDPLRYLPRK